MAGMDKYRHSSGTRVKLKICGRLPSFHQILTRYEVSCLLVLSLLSYASSTRRRRRKTWTKSIFCYNFGQTWSFSERLGTQLSLDICCAVKSLKVEIESKNCISKCMGRPIQKLQDCHNLVTSTLQPCRVYTTL